MSFTFSGRGVHRITVKAKSVRLYDLGNGCWWIVAERREAPDA